MIDTMNGVKIIGGFCGTFLVFLLAKWGAETIYHVGPVSHGGEEHAAGYVIPVEESGTPAPVEEGPSFEELWASADAAAGENLFRNCRSCHSIEAGANGTGPSLHGVVGRAIDAEPGYNYSGALLQVGADWTPENLFNFLQDPRGTAPGTKMTYAGMRSAQDRVNLIAWLDGLDG